MDKDELNESFSKIVFWKSMLNREDNVKWGNVENWEWSESHGIVGKGVSDRLNRNRYNSIYSDYQHNLIHDKM